MDFHHVIIYTSISQSFFQPNCTWQTLPSVPVPVLSLSDVLVRFITSRKYTAKQWPDQLELLGLHLLTVLTLSRASVVPRVVLVPVWRTGHIFECEWRCRLQVVCMCLCLCGVLLVYPLNPALHTHFIAADIIAYLSPVKLLQIRFQVSCVSIRGLSSIRNTLYEFACWTSSTLLRALLFAHINSLPLVDSHVAVVGSCCSIWPVWLHTAGGMLVHIPFLFAG